MNKRLVEWATAEKRLLVERGMGDSMASWGAPYTGAPVGAPDSRSGADEASCGCTGQCGCGGSAGRTCSMCGGMLMTDSDVCDECGMYEAVGDEGTVKTCDECGGMYEGSYCVECGRSGMLEAVILEAKKHKGKRKKGPSKKTAKKMLKGTKTFAAKVKKVSSWADNPPAAAAWLMHKATGKWPSQK